MAIALVGVAFASTCDVVTTNQDDISGEGGAGVRTGARKPDMLIERALQPVAVMAEGSGEA